MARLVEHHSPWSGLQREDDEAEVGVLGIPFDSAVSWRGGARHAPEHEVTPQTRNPGQDRPRSALFTP